MPKIFPFQYDLPKKKKKGHHADRDIFFSNFILISKKKKKWFFVWILQVFYALRAAYESEAPWTAAVYGFWRETKTPVFGGRKNAGIRKISVQKCRKKICTFLH